MRPDAADPAGLERVWKYDLLPLLEEHYYGRMSRSDVHDRFGLPALRRSLEPASQRCRGQAGSDEVAGR